MSLPATLGPLFDSAAVFTIARQLWAARERLSLRTGGHLPGATELAIALGLHTVDEDRLRLEQSPSDEQLTSSSDAPDATLLARYLTIADAAYALDDDKRANILNNLNLTSPLISKLLAEKWSPGYFLSYEPETNFLFLAVRGSKEVSDFLTNLSAETEPFLDGRGHQGVVKSAENLDTTLRQELVRYIKIFNAERLIVVGHSLGGAVAAAMTLLLRELRELETRKTAEVLKNAECFSFGAPPFLCEDMAKFSEGRGITSLVHNLDMVSRLSAASVDRLLVRVSRYDWGGHMSDWVGRTVGTVASNWLPEQSAQGLSESIRHSGATGLAAASQTIGETARALGGAAGSGGLWRAAMNATAAVGELLAGELAQSRRRRDSYGFARVVGMDENDVERLVGTAPVEVFVAGEVWCLERKFTDPGVEGAAEDLEVGRLVRGDRNTLTDVEVSGWMVYDHHPEVMVRALAAVAANKER